jgi:hypothetical protein
MHVCYNFPDVMEKAFAVTFLKICEAENSDGHEAD